MTASDMTMEERVRLIARSTMEGRLAFHAAPLRPKRARSASISALGGSPERVDPPARRLAGR